MSPLCLTVGYSRVFLFNPRIALDIQSHHGCAAMPKFMQSLNDHMYKELEKLAKQRGITVQELIRAVILPEWLVRQEEREKKH